MTIYRSTEFEALRGLTLSSVEVNRSVDDSVTFLTDTGRQFVLRHDQDCCESVDIEDVVGDVEDLVGSPIILAEESMSQTDSPISEYDESHTWTFYRLATAKGYVTIRWYGSSNGYYSERVDFYEVVEDSDDD